jgi:hypothetical protein
MDLFFIIIPIYPWENGDLYLRNHPVTLMEVDMNAILDASGKNGQVKKVCRSRAGRGYRPGYGPENHRDHPGLIP